MQSGLLLFLLLSVAACWMFVVGHQLGWSSFDPNRYAILEGTLTIAYIVAGLSVCFAIVTIVASPIRK
jgi:hypothetical protein